MEHKRRRIDEGEVASHAHSSVHGPAAAELEPPPSAAAIWEYSTLGFGASVVAGSSLWRWVLSAASAHFTGREASTAQVDALDISPECLVLSDAAERVRSSGESYMVTWLPNGTSALALTTKVGSLYILARHDASPAGGLQSHGASCDDSNSIALGPDGARLSITRVKYPCRVVKGAPPPGDGGFTASLSTGFIVHDQPSAESRARGGPGADVPRARLLLHDALVHNGSSIASKPLHKRLGILKQWIIAGLATSSASEDGRAAAVVTQSADDTSPKRLGFYGANFHEPFALSDSGVATLCGKFVPSLPHPVKGLLLLPTAAASQLAEESVTALPRKIAIDTGCEVGASNSVAASKMASICQQLVQAAVVSAATSGSGAAAHMSSSSSSGQPAPRPFRPVAFTAPAPPAHQVASDRTSLLVIVPYRDQSQQNRAEQLRQFAAHMPAFLRSAAIVPPLASFHVMIVEQSDDGCKFNRGKALNVGMRIALDGPNAAAAVGLPPCVANATALCLHDVDLLPQPVLGPYYARLPGRKPLHVGGAWKRYPYDSYVGGVITLSREHAARINGFPNNFWGWGGEDDALSSRMQATGLFPPERPGRETDNAYVDLEEQLIAQRGGVRAGTSAKAGGRNEWRNLLKREQMDEQKAGWRDNGVNSCAFTVVGCRAVNPDVSVVTVDLHGRDDALSSPGAQEAEMNRLITAIERGEKAELGRRYR